MYLVVGGNEQVPITINAVSPVFEQDRNSIPDSYEPNLASFHVIDSSYPLATSDTFVESTHPTASLVTHCKSSVGVTGVTGVIGLGVGTGASLAVSYTHLTLPTNREV